VFGDEFASRGNRDSNREMKRMLGLSRLCVALLSVIAICAIATASASAALPEFAGPFVNKFTFTSKPVLLELETKAGKMECGEAVGNGEIVAAKELKVAKITYDKCTSPFGECKTPGQAAGVVVTGELVGILGYLNKTEKLVGLDLDPKTQPFANVTCGVVTFEVKGDVIGRFINALNTKTKIYELKYEQAEGKQKWQKLEGGNKSILETLKGGLAEALATGLATELTLKLENESEIKA
jgi:hypothetical protein